jgi:hypothetical protein
METLDKATSPSFSINKAWRGTEDCSFGATREERHWVQLSQKKKTQYNSPFRISDHEK